MGFRDAVTPWHLKSWYLQKGFLGGAIVVSVLVNPWLLRSFHKLSHWSCGSAPNANPRNLKIAKSTPTTLDHNLSISRPMVFQWFWRLFQCLDSSPYFRQTFCHISGSARSLERLGGWYWPVIGPNVRVCCMDFGMFWSFVYHGLALSCLGPFSVVHAIEILLDHLGL